MGTSSVFIVCCSHMVESALTGSPVILEHTLTVICRRVLFCRLKGAFRPNATDANIIASDASITPLDHFGVFASFASFAPFISFALARSFLNRYFSTRSLCTSVMADITTIAALYLLYKSQKRRKPTRCRVWIHEVLRRHTELGEFHSLLQELRLYDNRFQRYLRLTEAQFENLLARVGARISRPDTNYRRSISAAERLSTCLRLVAGRTAPGAHTQLQLASPPLLL